MVSERCEEIHEKALIVDALSFPYILEERHLARVREGGVHGALITVAISESFKEGIKKIYSMLETIDEKRGEFAFAVTAQQIKEAREENRLALIFGFQDIAPLEGDIDLLKVFYHLGVRVIQLTYTGGNLAGDGCGEWANGGLRFFGRDLIEELNRLGILLDLSHCGDSTTYDAIKYSKDPVVFTHSNCRSLCENPRNKTDEQIELMAKRGGFIGLTPHPALVGGEKNLESFLDHFDYVVELTGTEHPGIGLDYIEGLKEEEEIPEAVKIWRRRRPDIFGTLQDFYSQDFAAGLETIDRLPHLTEGLLKRGYSSHQIEGFLGGNFLRVFQEVVG